VDEHSKRWRNLLGNVGLPVGAALALVFLIDGEARVGRGEAWIVILIGVILGRALGWLIGFLIDSAINSGRQGEDDQSGASEHDEERYPE
jgi:hypothetical protein